MMIALCYFEDAIEQVASVMLSLLSVLAKLLY